jgi:hypothetical protein
VRPGRGFVCYVSHRDDFSRSGVRIVAAGIAGLVGLSACSEGAIGEGGSPADRLDGSDPGEPPLPGAPGAGGASALGGAASARGGQSARGGAATPGGTSGSAAGGSDPGPGVTGGSPGNVAIACDENVPNGMAPLRRLGRGDYESSLGELLAPRGLDGELAAIEDDLAQLPPDGENEALFSDMDARVTQRHVDAYYGVADALAGRVTADAGKLEALAGECASATTPSASCVRDFVTGFGAEALRRPLTDAEVERYVGLADGVVGPEAFRRITFSLLLAPGFLYQVELGEAAGDDYSLTTHELAQRLSFHFLRSAPDAELRLAAESGELATEAGYEAAVERLLDDPRTKQTIFRFYEEWYQLPGFAGFASTPSFRNFSEGVNADLELFQDMLDEFDTLIDYTTWQTDGSYADLLTSDLAFVRSERLADLYGIQPWTGAGMPPRFPAGQRGGLLTRAAALVEGNELTNPVKRGAFVLKHVFCQDLSPPSNLPAEALALPPADPNRSTRERFETKTSPDECVGCHSLINPLGFALEAYDALGRYRTTETIFEDDGSVAAVVPVDSRVEVSIDGRVVAAADPVAFSEAIAASPKATECFARQYFRYSRRRYETASDSCTVAAIADAAGVAGSLRQALRSIALHPSFKKRVVTP